MSHAYSLHDTLIHVPLIVRYPAVFPPGQRVTKQVQLTDLFPTVLDVLGLGALEVRQELQGVSLLAPPPIPRRNVWPTPKCWRHIRPSPR